MARTLRLRKHAQAAPRRTTKNFVSAVLLLVMCAIAAWTGITVVNRLRVDQVDRSRF